MTSNWVMRMKDWLKKIVGASTGEEHRAEPSEERVSRAERRRQKRLDSLKQKYRRALEVAEEEGVILSRVELSDDALYLEGLAPSLVSRELVMQWLQLVDPDAEEWHARLGVDPTILQDEENDAIRTGPRGRVYIVQEGETLPDVASHLGEIDPRRLHEANRERVIDPDDLPVGLELLIPRRRDS